MPDKNDIEGLRSAIRVLTPNFQTWIGKALDELVTLRAQADARPFGYKSFDDWCEEIIADGGHTVRSWIEGQDPMQAAREAWEVGRYMKTQEDARPMATAVYQRSLHGTWFDIQKAEYDKIGPSFRRVLYTAPPAESAGVGLSDAQREVVREAVRTTLWCTYDCTRVWDAWNVGTMSQDDFVPTADDESRVAEIADAAIDATLQALSRTHAADGEAGGTPDTFPARLLHESDKSLAERVDSWHERHPQAAQQQAEPGADERAAFEEARNQALNVDWFTWQIAWAYARAAQSGQRAGVAEGWKLVPVEPTQAMIDAWNDSGADDFKIKDAAYSEFTDEQWEEWKRANAVRDWSAMLAAAPQGEQK